MSEIFQEEIKYLNYVTKFIDKRLSEFKEALNKQNKAIKEESEDALLSSGTLINSDEGNFGDTSQNLDALKTRHMNRQNINDTIKQLERLKSKPYFGKVVLSTGERIYIGNSSLKDNDETILIHDWRTPIASVFYENSLGKLSFRTPDNRNIEVNVIERRQFEIEDGKILNMFDSEEYIADEALRELLKTTDTSRLKNIVSTIQQEQNDVIRLPINQSSRVYGPPGSGKTTIALQRIAFLLYQNRKTFTNEQLMLFLPNEIFNDYISDVLPELGESHVLHDTFHRLRKKFRYFNNRKVETVSEAIIRVNDTFDKTYYDKTSIQFLERLDHEIKQYSETGVKFRDIPMVNKNLVSKEEMERYFYSNPNRTIRNRITLIRELIKSRFNDYIKKIAEFRFNQLNNSSEYLGEREELIKMSRQFAREKLKQAQLMYQTYRFIDVDLMYEHFLQKYDYKQVNTSYIRYEDLPPMMYILSHFTNHYDNSIKHIIIDEVQDYSNIQFKLIQSYYRQATFTLLGDRNQTMYPFKIDEINEGFSEKRLTKSYRSTKEIIDYMQTIIDVRIETTGKAGEPVSLLEYISIDELKHIIKEGHGRKAIITTTKEAENHLFKQLENVEVKLLEEEGSLYSQKDIILPYYLAKGFEYETVIILSNNDYQNNYIRYILASRAIEKLIVVN